MIGAATLVVTGTAGTLENGSAGGAVAGNKGGKAQLEPRSGALSSTTGEGSAAGAGAGLTFLTFLVDRVFPPPQHKHAISKPRRDKQPSTAAMAARPKPNL